MDNVFLDFDGLSRFKDKLDENTAAVVNTLVPKTDFNAFKQEAKSTYARKDGFYETLGAGSALNLAGNTPIESEFSFRPTAGASTDIGSGNAVLDRIKGNAVKFNQLMYPLSGSSSVNGVTYTYNNDGSITLNGECTGRNNNTSMRWSSLEISLNHKYYVRSDDKTNFTFTNTPAQLDSQSISFNGHPSIKTCTTAGSPYFRLDAIVGQTYNNHTVWPIFIDLTAIFGEGNEPETVEEFETWLDEHVGLRDYYPYDTGSLVPVRTSGLRTVGFNAYNNGSARVIGGKEYQITGTYTSLSQDGEAITPDTDGKFTPSKNGDVVVVGGGSDTCIHLVHSGAKDGEYEEYWESTLPLPITSITGKLNGEGESVLVCPDGLKRAGDVYDEIKVENGVTKLIKRVGSVDMGTLTWTKTGAGNMFTSLTDIYGKSGGRVLNQRYPYGGSETDKSCWVSASGFYVKDSTYSDAATFKTAMNGVILYYELETPQEYVLDNFELPSVYRVDDFGTEEILPNSGDVLTALPTLKVTYNMNASDTIKNLPVNYVQREDVKHTIGNSEKFVLSQKGVNQNYAKKSGVENDLVSGAAKTLLGNTSSPAEYVFRKVPDGAATGNALLMSVKGKSLVWSQGVNLSSAVYLTVTGGTAVINGHDIEYTGDASTEKHSILLNYTPNKCNVGDIILAVGYVKFMRYLPASINEYNGIRLSGIAVSSPQTYVGVTELGVYQKSYHYAKVSAYGSAKVRIGYTDESFDASIRNLMFFNLTQMFGAGNEPSTIEEFEAMFPLPYYEYNEGTLINNKTEQIESVGFNQWDEEWENGGYDTSTGAKTNTSGQIRSKNMIQAFANNTYFVQCPSNKVMQVFCYDANGLLITGWNGGYNFKGFITPDNFTTPAGTVKMAFHINGTIYTNDICINLSDPNKNGTYEPYNKQTLELNLPTLTGKVNGEGESVVICADGLKSAGSAYDEGIVENGYLTKIVKRIGEVDMGTLTWNKFANSSRFYANINGAVNAYTEEKKVNIVSPFGVTTTEAAAITPTDGLCMWSNFATEVPTIRATKNGNDSTTPAEFKTMVSGTPAYYELATPQNYVLDTPVLVRYNVEAGGTERRLPEDTASVVNAPFRADVKYSIDAVGFINQAPQNYISKESDDSLLAAINAAISGNITKTWDASQNKYVYTFTPNA